LHGAPPLDFAEFYRGSADERLRAVLVSVGELDTAHSALPLVVGRTVCVDVRIVIDGPAGQGDRVRIKVAASSLGSYSTRGGTSAWGVRITSPSRPGGWQILHLRRGEATVIWLNVVLLALAGAAIWLSTTWL
jgi:hypothetical protein